MWILILQVTKRREDLYQVIFSLSITLQLVGKRVYILLLLYQPLKQNKFQLQKTFIWLRGLVNDLEFLQDTTTIFCDRKSVIHLTKNQIYYKRTKHIDVKHHFIRVIVARGEITLGKFCTTHNLVDILTNPDSLFKLKHFLDLIGVDCYQCPRGLFDDVGTF